MIARTRSRIREKWPYLLFLVGLLALVAYTYSLTMGFRVPQTGELPHLVLAGMTIVLVLDLVLTLFPRFLPDPLKTDSTTLSSFENRSIAPVNIAIQFGWVICFLAMMYFIGFFTATFAFAFLYIFVYGPEESPQRRAAIGAAWAVGINGFLYVLFVKLLQVGSIFQFGLMI